MSTKIVHNDMYVKVKKVNEEVRALYYSNYVNLEVILNMIGDDFLKYTINMSELCNIKKIKATYLDLLVKYGITHPSIKHKFIELFGNKPIVCKWPSRDNPKHYYDRSIIPAKDRANPEYIRFDFMR